MPRSNVFPFQYVDIWCKNIFNRFDMFCILPYFSEKTEPWVWLMIKVDTASKQSLKKELKATNMGNKMVLCYIKKIFP